MKKTYKIFLLIFPVALLLLTSYIKTTNVSFEAFYNTDQPTFFKFISDPTNLKRINPTIIGATLNSLDSNSWTTTYVEHLVQLPFIKNFINAEYRAENNGEVGKIESKHTTCFFTENWCLPSNSTLTVTAANKKLVHYQENITYTCPWVLTHFCKNEVEMQRKLIMDNLGTIFGKQ